MTRAALLLLAAAVSAGELHARPLTIRTGESWVFAVRNGQPADARKVDAKAKPARGQLMVTVRAMLGTALIATNNSNVAYRFRAELLDKGKASLGRSCTLPTGNKPIFEQWPKKAEAVRIGTFVATGADGRC